MCRKHPRVRPRSGCGRCQRRCRRYFNVRGLARVRTGERDLDRVRRGAAGATIDGTTYAYIADGENVIRRVDLTTGQAQVVAGNGGFAAPTAGSPATSTPTAGPEDVTVDAAGDFAFETSREIVFVPAASGAYFGQAMTAGDIYVLGVTAETIALEPDGSLLYDYDGVIRVDPVSTGASTGMLAEGDIDNLSISADPAHDGNFAFVVGDTGPSKAGHEIDYYAAHAGTYFGLSMSEGIHAIADTANEGGLGVDSGDGGPATNAIVNPGSTGYYSLAFDAAGDLLVLDTGEDGIHDGQQRLIAATSCSSNCVFGLPAMNAGYIYRTELAAKTIAIAGSEDVFADEGFAGNALYSPIGTDEGIVVGDGTYGYDGDGSTGASSELANVSWVASDPVGDVAIVDSADSRVRFMPASSGSFYGQSMTAGHLYTVAGNGILAPESGSSGYGGDEGPEPPQPPSSTPSRMAPAWHSTIPAISRSPIQATAACASSRPAVAASSANRCSPATSTRSHRGSAIQPTSPTRPAAASSWPTASTSRRSRREREPSRRSRSRRAPQPKEWPSTLTAISPTPMASTPST